MRKLWLLSNLLLLPLAAQSELDDYLSLEKRIILEYQEQIDRVQSDLQRRTWISPILLSYTQSSDNHSLLGKQTFKSWSISIDQPIFKSGGIYYAIKFADAQERVGVAKNRLLRRQLIVQALTTLFELRKNRLQQKQMRLKIRNDSIDIKRKREQYSAGLIDSSFLDQAILQRNQDQRSLLELKLAQKRLRSTFAKLSRRNPDRLRLPRLRLIGAKEFFQKNLDIELERYKLIQSDYASKITRSKYLPTISFNAKYSFTDSDTPTPAFRKDYYSYGLRITMPLSINAAKDIEASRLKFLQESARLQDTKRKAQSEYRLTLDTLAIIEKKIALAHSNERLYRNLLKSTKEQAAAGRKTSLDVEIMQNSMNIAKLDAKIYDIERQIELLKLYEKVGE